MSFFPNQYVPVDFGYAGIKYYTNITGIILCGF